jgi:hypothetical protein
MDKLKAISGRILVFTSAISLIMACVTGLEHAAAQDDRTVALSDLVVSWSEPWVLDPATSANSLLFTHDDHRLHVARVVNADAGAAIDDSLSALGADIDTRSTVDSGESDDVSYALDLVVANGDVAGSFAIVRRGADVQVLTLFLAPVAEFAQGFALAQSTVTIDGAPVFDGVGGDGLQSALDSALPAFEAPVASPAGQASPVADASEPTAPVTSDPTEEPGGEPTSAVTPEPTQQSTEEPVAEPTTEPTETPDGPQIEEPSDDARDDMGGNDNDVPYDDVGMVGTRAYESPQYGVAIEWTRDWELDEDFGPAVVSDPKLEQDTVHLLWTSEWSAWMTIYVIDSYSVAIPDFVDYYSDNIPYGDDAEVVLSDASSTMGGIVTLIDEGEAYPTLIYDEIRYGPERDSLVVIQLISLDPNVTDGIIRAARNDISIDGEPALSFFHPDDVGDIHEDGGEEPESPTLNHPPQAISRLAGSRPVMRHLEVTPRSRNAGATPAASRVRTCLTRSRGLA